MNFFLHNNGLIWLAPLIAIPVLLHFLARARPPRYLFSATLFIMKVVQQTIRIKRPKDRLLLLCRTLLFIVLFIIFLRPVIFVRDLAIDRDLPQNLVIVIDRSASMAWSEGGRSRFTAACDEAAVILDRLSSRDVANVVWLDMEPDAVFPEMGSNIPYLRNRLREARATNESGNSASAIQLALSHLKTGAGVRELCIISDFQASQWKDFKLTVPDDINVSSVWPVRDEAVNGAVLSIRTDPLSPLIGEPAQVICDIGNFSGTPRNRTVILEIGEKRTARQVQIPAWGHGAVAVEHVFSKYGQITVSARLDEDAYGADDWRGIIVPVRNALKVGIFGDDPYIAPVWRRALNALPWIEAVEITSHILEAPAHYDLFMLAGWKGEHIETLATLRTEGIPIIFSPAPGLPLDKIAILAGTGKLPDTAAVALETMDQAVGLQIPDKTHKAFSLFLDGAFGDPAQAAFNRRLRFPSAGIAGKTIFSYMDGEPALIQCESMPPVIIWLAPLSPECSDWAAQATFLPFLGELINTVQAHKVWHVPDTALPGETLSFKTTAQFDDICLRHGTDTEIPVTRVDSVDDGTCFVSEPITKPGVYRLCAREDCPRVRIVNFPVIESDLRVKPPPMITEGSVQTAQNAAELQAAREGTPLWKILVWVAICLICIESALVLLLDFEDKKLAEGSP